MPICVSVQRSGNDELMTTYNKAVCQLADFRRVHLYIVKRYVVDMKAKFSQNTHYGSVATKVFDGTSKYEATSCQLLVDDNDVIK